MNFKLALTVLARHRVEFMILGGAAVVAHGSTDITCISLDRLIEINGSSAALETSRLFWSWRQSRSYKVRRVAA